jgi:hypothetical protein
MNRKNEGHYVCTLKTMSMMISTSIKLSGGVRKKTNVNMVGVGAEGCMLGGGVVMDG